MYEYIGFDELLEREYKHVKPNDNIKCVIVGSGGVGKTTFLHKVVYEYVNFLLY